MKPHPEDQNARKKPLTMIHSVLDFFSTRDLSREAVVGLARILNRHDVSHMAFEAGYEVDRRDSEQRNVSWGVWLLPITADADMSKLQLDHSLPAVTQDLRRKGIGVMTPMRLNSNQFVIALPEDTVPDSYAADDSPSETRWNFFRCDVRHNTRCTGAWYQLGLQVAEAITLGSVQQNQFREHIAAVKRQADV